MKDTFNIRIDRHFLEHYDCPRFTILVSSHLDYPALITSERNTVRWIPWAERIPLTRGAHLV